MHVGLQKSASKGTQEAEITATDAEAPISAWMKGRWHQYCQVHLHKLYKLTPLFTWFLLEVIQVGTLCCNSAEISTENLLGLFQVRKQITELHDQHNSSHVGFCIFTFLLNWTLQYNPFNHGINLLEKSQFSFLQSIQEASSHST